MLRGRRDDHPQQSHTTRTKPVPRRYTDETLGAAAGLVDKAPAAGRSAVPTRPLYQMLETVRGYAELELAAVGERDDALEGLARDAWRKRPWPQTG